MKDLLKSNLAMVLIGSLLYLGVTFGVIVSSIGSLKGSAVSHSGDQEEEVAVMDGPSWTYFNPKLNELILELRTRLEKVKEKEEELKLWELQLEEELTHIRGITNVVENIRAEVNLAANKLTKTEETNIRSLLPLYKSLDPADAASLIEKKSDAEIAKIFHLLKAEEYTPIIQLWLRQNGEQAERVYRILKEYEAIATDVQAGA
jgi:hypothetical protein